MDIKKIREFFKKHTTFLILGHMEPDGDCISSQVCLSHFLTRIGKNSFCFSEGPFNRPEIAEFASQFKAAIPLSLLDKETAVIIVDCSSQDRVGELYASVAHKPKLIIDHHITSENFGDLCLIDHKAPSTTWLVYQIIDSLGYTPNSYEAFLLLFGLCTDTGFFRHLDKSSYNVFSFVSTVLDKGVSLKKVYNTIYGSRTLAQRKLLARLLKRSESYLNDKIIFTYQTLIDKKNLEPGSRNSDELYGLLQTIKNNEIVVFIRQESANHCSVGLRSMAKYDVAKIAKIFGGGGHKLAAGFNINGTIKEVKKIILKKIGQVLQEKP
jgi:phosphoesterase RecJ-like protein